MGKTFDHKIFRRLLLNIGFLCIIVALGNAATIGHWAMDYNITTVEGVSMSPSLKDGQMVYQDYDISNIQRYDTITFKIPVVNDNIDYCIKRVYGLPGETIEIKNGNIYINGIQIEDEYGVGYTSGFAYTNETITLKENEYFVLGDNREKSLDSRNSECGLVPLELIRGIVR